MNEEEMNDEKSVNEPSTSSAESERYRIVDAATLHLPIKQSLSAQLRNLPAGKAILLPRMQRSSVSSRVSQINKEKETGRKLAIRAVVVDGVKMIAVINQDSDTGCVTILV